MTSYLPLNICASLFSRYAPSHIQRKVASSNLLRSSSISLRSTSGNHGLSRQFISQTNELSGGFFLNLTSTGDPSFSGLYVTQIDEPASRMVGNNFCHAVSLTDSASSTQHTWMPAFDLTLSRLCLNPVKM